MGNGGTQGLQQPSPREPTFCLCSFPAHALTPISAQNSEEDRIWICDSLAIGKEVWFL